jgi:hypothetical protein
MRQVGRPSTYTEDMPEKMIKWFNRPIATYSGHKTTITKFPTFERFALEHGVHHQTLLNWCDKHAEFLEAYNVCKGIQKDLLIEGGLSGIYKERFAMFLSVNVSDLKDKVEQTIDQKVVQVSLNYKDE